MTLTPAFDPQTAAYTASTVERDDSQTRAVLTYTKQSDEQNVTLSLGGNTCGASLVTMAGNTLIDWGTSGETIPQAELPSWATSGKVGTVDILFTVTAGDQVGAYTVTVTRTYYTTAP